MKVLHLTYKIKRGELLSDYLTILIENERAQSVKVEMATTKKEFSKMLLRNLYVKNFVRLFINAKLCKNLMQS